MILRNKTFTIIALFLITTSIAQEMVFNSQPKLMQVSNPSFFGLNSWNRSGLLYNSTEINPNETQNNKFFYGSYSFDLLDFSLGIQFNNFSAPNIGYRKNDLNLSYIYKIELGNDMWFLPSVNVGFVSKNKFLQYLKGASLFVNPMQITFGVQTKTLHALALGKTQSV